MIDAALLRKLEAAATPGEWFGGLTTIHSDIPGAPDYLSLAECKNRGDAAFIIAARNALPGLLNELEGLRHKERVTASENATLRNLGMKGVIEENSALRARVAELTEDCRALEGMSTDSRIYFAMKGKPSP